MDSETRLEVLEQRVALLEQRNELLLRVAHGLTRQSQISGKATATLMRSICELAARVDPALEFPIVVPIVVQ